MTIGINGNEANVLHRVGVGQYAYELIKQLESLSQRQEAVEIYLDKSPLSDFPKETSSWHYKNLGRGLPMWTATILQKQLLLEKLTGHAPSVFFSPSHYTPVLMPVKSVISIMDMSFVRFPEYFKKYDRAQLRYWTWVSAVQAKKIITISNFSKQEICSIYNLPQDKVIVTYCGYDRERFHGQVKNQTAEIKSTLTKYKITKPYLIFLGTLQPRKNIVRLIEAFARLQNKATQLVVVGMINEGRGGWMNESIFATVKRLGLEKQVIFTGYVLDNEVPLLFAGSRAYVLPSLYEGFGIPPVEAMATGIPVVVSRVSSLPEICGEAPVYIDNPESVEDITASLDSVLSLSDSERTRRVKLGQSFVTRYNWKTTAKQTLEILLAV